MTELQKDFIRLGGSTNASEISHIIMAAVYRKLNNQNFSIRELYSKYDERSYKHLIDSLRRFNLGDTVFYSWVIPKGISVEGYNEIGVVTGSETSMSGTKVQFRTIRISGSVLNMMRVRRLSPTRYFEEVRNRGKLIQKVGEMRSVESEFLRSWIEEIKILYPQIK
jgi:hypothetical protein